MSSERRLERINELIGRVISGLILETSHFPPNVFLTVTRVKISGHLEWVDIDVSVYPEQYQQKALAFLEHQRAEFQSEINEALQARRTPKIRFHLDDTLAKVEDIFPARIYESDSLGNLQKNLASADQSSLGVGRQPRRPGRRRGGFSAGP